MTDLHARLVAAVNARLEVARAVCREPKGIVWRTARDPWDGSRYHLHEVIAPDLIDPMGSMMVDPEVAAYINIHHTADAVLRYERDLRVLERHKPWTDEIIDDESPFGEFYWWCTECSGFGPLFPADDCAEIADLATAYGVGVDHA